MVQKSLRIIACFIFLFLVTETTFAMTVKDCMVTRLETADDTLTIGELRLLCKQEINSTTPVPSEESATEGATAVVDDRIDQDEKNVLRPYTLMAHKPNFILLGTYNGEGYGTTDFEEQYSLDNMTSEKSEMQFQLSIKFPLLVDLFNNTFDLYAAYTHRSFWQVYKASSPFRESNHEPETWIQFQPNWQFFGFTNSWNSFGFNHQSNGQGGSLSRSWNRLFGWITFERQNLAFSLRPWIRLPEDEDENDNPDITDYLGHFELSAAYKWHGHVFSMMSRNNLESGFERGAVELNWSFPLAAYPYLKGYVQYFYGYGESLVDYDQRVNRIGLGLCLVDWL